MRRLDDRACACPDPATLRLGAQSLIQAADSLVGAVALVLALRAAGRSARYLQHEPVGARIRFSRGEAVFVDQAAESISALDLV
jgi:hypothetical protein